jgi:hypothetical protein
MPMPNTLKAGLTDVQHVAMDLRRLLRDLGTDEQVLRRVMPLTDLDGAEFVHTPPLPVEVVQHLVRLLPAPPAPRRVDLR